MPRSNTGVSAAPGVRQVLLAVLDPSDTVVVIWVDPPSGAPPQKRWGYIKVERELNPSLAVDVVGGNVWVRGRYLYLPFSASNFIVTGFWAVSGVPWTCISGTP